MYKRENFKLRDLGNGLRDPAPQQSSQLSLFIGEAVEDAVKMCGWITDNSSFVFACNLKLAQSGESLVEVTKIHAQST